MTSAVLNLVNRVRLPLRGLLTAGSAAGGGLLLVLGSVLPWVAGPDASAVTYGAVETAAGGSALGSRAGLSGGDAFVALLAGAGVLALAWAMLNHAEIGDVAGPDGARLDIGPGVGVYVALFGALLVLVAAGTAPRDVEHDLRVLARRAERLAQRGLGFEAIEKQLLLRARRHPGWQDPQITFEVLFLARLYLAVGHVDRAVQLVHDVMGDAQRRFADDEEGQAAATAEASELIGEANAQLAAVQQLAHPWQSGR
ncbi:hypothetical protein EDC02_7400 [Micromonospora sp. Llam0]|nr:hypothetical protein EDC02_7400 [Micromonospora sp. Llam0]